MPARTSQDAVPPRILLPVGGRIAPVRPSRVSQARQVRLSAALDAIVADLDSDPDPFLPHLRQALHRLRAHFATPIIQPNAVVVMPPAAGKTKLFCRILATLSAQGHPGARPAMVLAPTKNLVRHTLAEIKNLGVLARLGWPRERRAPVHVMTYDSFQRAVDNGRLSPDDLDLIVLNDAHFGLSDKRQSLLDRFNYDCPILAFSATPSYHSEKTLFRILGRDNRVVDMSYAELRDDRVIAPIINYIVCVSLDGDLPRDKARYDLVVNNAIRAAVIEFYRTHEEPDYALVLREKPFIGFHATCADAQLATDAFNAVRRSGDLICETATGLDEWDRHVLAVENLQKGRVQGLNNAKIFVEGPNFDQVGAVLNFASTSSLVRQIQRCGRALAINPTFGRDDVRQTSAVVDVCLKVNGVVKGHPKFYFEAVADPSIARIVEMTARPWTDFADPYGADKPGNGGKGKDADDTASPGGTTPPDASAASATKRLPVPRYTVSAKLQDVHYLLKSRNRYASWKTRDEILADMPQAATRRVSAVFGAIEDVLAQALPGEAHLIPFEASLLQAGRELRGDTDETVYDEATVRMITLLVDQPSTESIKGGVVLDDLIGPSPDPALRARAERLAAEYLLCRRRGESGIRQTAEAGAIPILVLAWAMTPQGPRVIVPAYETARVRQLLGIA